ncbi:hypothetical protein [Streptomyces sp. NBC_01618]|nr:hypothetical protein OH735_01210 [Streptomyces sp. NBC_01618]
MTAHRPPAGARHARPDQEPDQHRAVQVKFHPGLGQRVFMLRE